MMSSLSSHDFALKEGRSLVVLDLSCDTDRAMATSESSVDLERDTPLLSSLFVSAMSFERQVLLDVRRRMLDLQGSETIRVSLSFANKEPLSCVLRSFSSVSLLELFLDGRA